MAIKKTVTKKVTKTAKAPVKKFNKGGEKKEVSKETKRKTKTYNERGGGLADVEVVGSGPGEYGDGYSKRLYKRSDGSGTMFINKNGKTSSFAIPAKDWYNQVKIAKAEAGYRKGGVKKTTKKVTPHKK